MDMFSSTGMTPSKRITPGGLHSTEDGKTWSLMMLKEERHAEVANITDPDGALVQGSKYTVDGNNDRHSISWGCSSTYQQKYQNSEDVEMRSETALAKVRVTTMLPAEIFSAATIASNGPVQADVQAGYRRGRWTNGEEHLSDYRP